MRMTAIETGKASPADYFEKPVRKAGHPIVAEAVAALGTRAAVAKALGVSPVTISNWMLGKYKIRARALDGLRQIVEGAA